GLGVVLATQNPADLDYKGLSNAGTWFIGRLQTERDKLRLLDGLAGLGVDRGRIDRMLGRLGKRVFLITNVPDDTPARFAPRWAPSSLCGPLSRAPIPRPPQPPAEALPAPIPPAPPPASREPDPQPDARPAAPSGIRQLYPKRLPASGVQEP